MELEPPVPVGQNTYLGCAQEDIAPPMDVVEERQEMYTRVLKDPKKFSHSKEEEEVMRLLSAPFVPIWPEKSTKPSGQRSVKAYQYKMCGHAEGCVDRYMELAKVDVHSLKQVATPCIDDHSISPEEMTTKGVLAPIAARIVLKVLYTA